jgi:DNA-binding transcriptional ArsR family regulator
MFVKKSLDFSTIIDISLDSDMKRDDFSIEAKFFRGLSDSTRLFILEALRDGEKTVSEIVELTQQSQPNISNHLKCLDECGLVKHRRDGKNIYYSLKDEKTRELLNTSEEIVEKVYKHIETCLRYK